MDIAFDHARSGVTYAGKDGSRLFAGDGAVECFRGYRTRSRHTGRPFFVLADPQIGRYMPIIADPPRKRESRCFEPRSAPTCPCADLSCFPIAALRTAAITIVEIPGVIAPPLVRLDGFTRDIKIGLWDELGARVSAAPHHAGFVFLKRCPAAILAQSDRGHRRGFQWRPFGPHRSRKVGNTGNYAPDIPAWIPVD